MLRTSAAALALLLLASVPGVAEPGDPVRGEALFADTCASCHGAASRLVRRIPKTDQAEAMLEAFLPGHYAPEPETRADIIAFLLSL